jgi:hypothetical protein
MRRRHTVRDWLGFSCLAACLLLLFGQVPAGLPAQGQPRATLSPDEITAQVATLTAIALTTPTATATVTPTATCSPGPQCVYLTSLEGLPPATPTPVLPPPSFPGSCTSLVDSTSAPNWPVKIVEVRKVSEVVYLQNLSQTIVSLDGWRMCSVRGPQQHTGISGVLLPGEVRAFVNPGGDIWRNDQTDDGALYNSQGQLVSYWYDR